ncbi:site-specific DNA-methyltransferase [Heliobacillus mobilis]|uniref:Methyltransferase n=1 Tax=Heliobacterium mobile TaxID=28064 RepID=A0A6I3SH50_HELMO|nr:DNA methyltransferase [Heliobacterium mobile]MTV48171.1 site-specific DNA-methyltransferase [Heliobacterium mobile]
MVLSTEKQRAGRNRTVTLSEAEYIQYASRLVRAPFNSESVLLNRIVHGDIIDVIDTVPRNSVDLLFLDPPYNLSKDFHGLTFNGTDVDSYTLWFDSWFGRLMPTLKPNASVYVCGDWKTSISIHTVLSKYLIIQNRITWEREKGRGAKANWKNSCEDIWFATKSKQYTFNPDAVKLKRRVIAPYREDGKPKDWEETKGGNFRETYPSNLWTDISVPFWSMPENTDHPTQKPEKLVAKIILASTNEGDVVFDPFVGSGTTAVVAKKLNRNFIAVDCNEGYGCLALKRLEMAETDKSIQGYTDGVFWERNTLAFQKQKEKKGEESNEASIFSL